ncbi:MAG: hypothetical protein D6B25_03710 [Desulfobulbaceae bacterium]|nr:MAG: hypothetical protein D6B25_03710 [Desulfobulbaceae bacterium]
MPSIFGIKVVKQSEQRCIVFEGNGRLNEKVEVFQPEDHIMLVVEQYHFKNNSNIIRRMNRVLRMNGLKN